MVKTDHSDSFQGSLRRCASAELGVGRRVSFELCRKTIRPRKQHPPTLWIICTTGTRQGEPTTEGNVKKEEQGSLIWCHFTRRGGARDITENT